MRIFDFSDYRKYVTGRVRSMPRAGRGEYLKIAKHLGVHTSTLSQVLSGLKQLTLDQACSLADYFGFNDLETQYLLNLVEFERAGTERLRATLKRQMLQIQERSRELSAVVPGKRSLSEEEKAIFYSNWFYPGIWALTSIPGHQTRDSISKYFELPKALVNRVISFLLSTGMCIEENGQLSTGTTYVHLEGDSPFIGRHHASWRQKAMERHPVLSESEIAYSSPMSLSRADAEKVRKFVVEWVEQVNRIRDPSPCEALYLLNIDWIKF